MAVEMDDPCPACGDAARCAYCDEAHRCAVCRKPYGPDVACVIGYLADGIPGAEPELYIVHPGCRPQFRELDRPALKAFSASRGVSVVSGAQVEA